ncbi:MAG: hypothetical protein F6K37_18840 [Moorea sp. SIO4E2]|uniref:hypothetical protein n=1 Tax=Moorena sp. SIO4E2 TaxID=2607826 RepID=UPI0013BB2C22|nr:hypothetical protein [Moorena sp. SIO4E2]NEQ07928.1 hypothetical protein [Moorena sp. SIO4E2]
METSKAINLSIQLSAVSYQPSAVSRQPSAVSRWPLATLLEVPSAKSSHYLRCCANSSLTTGPKLIAEC